MLPKMSMVSNSVRKFNDSLFTLKEYGNFEFISSLSSPGITKKHLGPISEHAGFYAHFNIVNIQNLDSIPGRNYSSLIPSERPGRDTHLTYFSES
ncbi:unnamed protein product [Moneuplotes crassus]|uniref:Uncharacterized protein n=1 Tax=Euplotes crassus TaxID=5936 RepID=A0AAD1XJN6_EUPCR|nr:unnamed protein product [Moneuplotes crassus]